MQKIKSHPIACLSVEFGFMQLDCVNCLDYMKDYISLTILSLCHTLYGTLTPSVVEVQKIKNKSES